MNELLWAIGATFLVSLISFIGILSLALSSKVLDKALLWLVGLSAGALMGGAFFHLIPEAVESTNPLSVGVMLIIGFSLFFIIERYLYWHHCHEGHCDIHTFSYMNLIGDAVHNLIDGMIIAASFLVNIPLGIATTIAIVAHEIPQEIGDFGVLVYGGFKKTKALVFNFITGLTAVLGAILGFFLSNFSSSFVDILVPFAAGGFIYIAASDLIPELHKEKDIKKSLISYIFFLAGIIFMYVIKFIIE